MARYRGPRLRKCRRLDFPVFESPKFSNPRKNYVPGQHGPGQRIVYVMINLGRFDYDIRKYVHFLEGLVIKTLKDFDITSHRWEKAIGVWTYKISASKSSDHLDQYKIASIGVRVRRKIAFHGLAINIAPNIQNFEGIIPCGIKNAKVTSVFDQGVETSMADFDKSLKSNFNKLLKTYSP